jgi:hypothetical protein
MLNCFACVIGVGVEVFRHPVVSNVKLLLSENLICTQYEINFRVLLPHYPNKIFYVRIVYSMFAIIFNILWKTPIFIHGNSFASQH